ncbi:MAG: hypothetical protein HKN70_14910 [Gammaproteobacteria bacterium]|nr:hypothetical protein [Gammaproteobacteria bacterium]
MTHYDNALYTGDAADQLVGTVFTLSDAEIAHADSYEKKAAYVRIEVLLKSGLSCWVYVDGRTRPPKTQNRGE